MMKRSDRTVRLATRTLATIIVVVFLAADASFASMVVGRATRSWGNVTVKRDGSTIPFVDGMDLEDGDEISTDRRSGAVYELLDRFGMAVVEEEIFGLPGPNGCADAPGDEGCGRVKIRARNVSPTERRIISDVKQGTTRTKTLPGGEEAAKRHEILIKYAAARTKGTEFALSFDPGLDQISLSTLDGLVEFDNIEYSSLPDFYFTDPGNKCEETLNLDVVLTLTTETVGLFDLLGAGNAVDVYADYYSIVASAPISPLIGKAPIHDLPGGLSPEPATMSLLAFGGLALLRRKK